MSYHSGKTKKQRELILNAFKNDTIKVLCSTKALNQGLDIPDANLGIMCGITSKSLPMIQRVGRLVRFQEGKTGEIIILYVKNNRMRGVLQCQELVLNIQMARQLLLKML